MKTIISLLLALYTLPSFADPMTFTWDPVTAHVDGTPVGAVVYKIYKKRINGPYLFLASRISTTYTWAEPQLGDWTFTVRAFNKNGESVDSNSVRVKVNACWEEVSSAGDLKVN